MVTIVFGRNIQKASEKVLSIYENIPKEEILFTKKTSFSTMVFMKNGDVIKSATANDSSRGLKFDEVYIDGLISQGIIQNIILPACKKGCKVYYF